MRGKSRDLRVSLVSFGATTVLVMAGCASAPQSPPPRPPVVAATAPVTSTGYVFVAGRDDAQAIRDKLVTQLPKEWVESYMPKRPIDLAALMARLRVSRLIEVKLYGDEYVAGVTRQLFPPITGDPKAQIATGLRPGGVDRDFSDFADAIVKEVEKNFPPASDEERVAFARENAPKLADEAASACEVGAWREGLDGLRDARALAEQGGLADLVGKLTQLRDGVRAEMHAISDRLANKVLHFQPVSLAWPVRDVHFVGNEGVGATAYVVRTSATAEPVRFVIERLWIRKTAAGITVRTTATFTKGRQSAFGENSLLKRTEEVEGVIDPHGRFTGKAVARRYENNLIKPTDVVELPLEGTLEGP